ncbi:YhgE/Pip domain-containing protein [Haloechinothrix sp. LS1_15]|uniref:YhgE/Pip domain-containing protein n=1 Tax=Haloechinothrix sp. LS1_15 TaxID=2652248 RepID=UPI002947D4D3|nr:YhgE/Pip domain-containing protein [Haloechinothrix sp. LS1_15]MDV6012523.1 YhgE/Pip domain-containing protein [Haloechinothrix sp. LS1_15]
MFESILRTARGQQVPGQRSLSWRGLAAVILVPVVVLSLLTWAFWSPASAGAPAAVVNQDEPVEVNGQLTPLGRELAAKLTQSEDSPYDWELTDAADARSGVADGRYAASAVIPEEFSARATSTVADDPMAATRALLRVEISPSAGLLDPRASMQAAEDQVYELGREVVQMHIDQLYEAFAELHGGLDDAAGGAGELAGGADELTGGAGELAGGARELDDAARQLAAGAEELAAGTGQLAGGSGELAGGLADLHEQTADLPGMTRQLADGARRVAEGNALMAETVAPLADRLIAAVDELPAASDTADRVRELARQCEDELAAPVFCEQLADVAGSIGQHAELIDAAVERVRDAAEQAKAAVTGQAEGSQQVADGAEQLAEAMPPLVAGIGEAASGAQELDTGVRELDAGAAELADGSGQLSVGVAELADGTGELVGGARQLHGGTEELASQLEDGRDQVPHHDDEERDHLSQVAASPLGADVFGSPDLSRAAVALFVVLALWAAALATYLIVPAVPRDTLTSREPTWRLVARAALPAAAVSGVLAVAVSLGLWPLLGLSGGQVAALFAATALAAGTFMVVNQALVALLGQPGRVVSLAVLLLTPAIALTATVPDAFAGLGAWLPTYGATQTLTTITTGSSAALTGVGALLAWSAVGGIALIAATDRHRTLPAKGLRQVAASPA